MAHDYLHHLNKLNDVNAHYMQRYVKFIESSTNTGGVRKDLTKIKGSK